MVRADTREYLFFCYAGLYSPWSPTRGLARLDASGSPRLPNSTRQSARTAPRHHRAALPAHSAAGTIGTLVLGAVQLREPLWGGRVDADLEQVAAGAAVGRMVRGGRRRTGVVAPVVR